jgi:hypothetical protein
MFGLKKIFLWAGVLMGIQGLAFAGTFISVCDDKPELATARQQIFWDFPSGKAKYLSVSEQPPSQKCDVLPIPDIRIDELLWMRLVSPEKALKLQNGMILTSASEQSKEFSEIIPLDETAKDGNDIPSAKADSSATGNQMTFSTWLWQPTVWQNIPDGLWEKLKGKNLKRIFITVPVNADQSIPEKDKLRTFITEAAKRNVEVWTVEGEPQAILPDVKTRYIQHAKAFHAYNQQVSATEKIKGIQYDIEPYLLPGYDLKPAEVFKLYVETLREIRHVTSLPIDVALPFWAADIRLPDKKRLLDHLGLASLTDSITVMDYRTKSSEILRQAEPFLVWGDLYGRKVSVALEAGELPKEWRHVYRPSTGKSYLKLSRIGDTPILLLTSKEWSSIPGAGFAFSHLNPVEQTNTTFFGRLSAMESLLPELRENFRKHQSFQGLSVHGYFP